MPVSSLHLTSLSRCLFRARGLPAICRGLNLIYPPGKIQMSTCPHLWPNHSMRSASNCHSSSFWPYLLPQPHTPFDLIIYQFNAISKMYLHSWPLVSLIVLNCHPATPVGFTGVGWILIFKVMCIQSALHIVEKNISMLCPNEQAECERKCCQIKFTAIGGNQEYKVPVILWWYVY